MLPTWSRNAVGFMVSPVDLAAGPTGPAVTNPSRVRHTGKRGSGKIIPATAKIRQVTDIGHQTVPSAYIPRNTPWVKIMMTSQATQEPASTIWLNDKIALNCEVGIALLALGAAVVLRA